MSTWPEGLTSGSYVRLTTFRQDGRPVPTPVWFAVDGDGLVAFTGAGAGKTKRLRHTPRVLVCACTARGVPSGPEVEARAELDEGPGAHDARRAVARRHRLVFPLWSAYFRLFQREEYDHPVGIRVRPVAERADR